MKSDYKKNSQLYTIDYILRFFFIPIAIWPLVWARHLSAVEIGSIFTIGFIVSTILELPSGALADSIGRKKTVILGHFFRVIGFLCIIFGESYWWFLLANIFDQTFEALYSGAGQALVYDSLKENDREDSYEELESRSYVWATNGFIPASILGGLLFSIHYKLPYVAILIPAVIDFSLSFFYQEPVLDSSTSTLKQYLHQNIDGVKHIFRHREIALISVYSVAISFVFLTGLWWLYQAAANELVSDPRYVGFLIAGLYLTRSFGTKITQKQQVFQGKHRLVWLALLQGIASLVTMLLSSLIGILGMSLRYICDGIRQPILSSEQNKHIESRYRATSLSAISLITSLCLASAMPFIGWGIELFSARMVIGVTAVVSLVIALPVAVMLDRIPKNYTK